MYRDEGSADEIVNHRNKSKCMQRSGCPQPRDDVWSSFIVRNSWSPVYVRYSKFNSVLISVTSGFGTTNQIPPLSALRAPGLLIG